MAPTSHQTTPRPKRLRRITSAAIAAGMAASVAVFATAGPAQADEIGGWELDALNVHDAWDTTQGEGVTIAVVDTGVGEHPYFDDKDVLPGHSFIDDETDARFDEHGHGSSVAASALAVAPEATLLPVKYTVGESERFGGEEDHFTRLAGRDIVWAVDNGADIIALPWGRINDDHTEQNALQYAMDNDVLVVAGAGNDPDEAVWWPAAYDGVVAVSGTDENNDLYVDSTTGDEVTVAAPATDITTTEVQRGVELSYDYEQGWGTSIGTGLAAGVAGLVLAADPEVDANNAIARMTDTAVDLGDSGWDPEFGHGLLDANAAVSSTIDEHDENPLGYPLGEAGADVEVERFEGEEAPEETDNNGTDEENTSSASDDTAQTEEQNYLGLPPTLFWGITALTILTIVLTTAFLLHRNRKQIQQTQHWQPPTGTQPPGY